MLDHKTSLKKLKVVIQYQVYSLTTDQNRNKLDINNINKFSNSHVWKWNNIYTNNQCVQEEITNKIRKYFEVNENENTIRLESLGCS